MKNFIKTTSITLLFCLCISFISFGWNEGLNAIKYTSKEQVWMYYTGGENDDGGPLYLKNQWKQLGDDWFYFGEDGWSKQNTWMQIDGKWYYFNEKSRMIHDTITPDGYTVGSDGAWIEKAPV